METWEQLLVGALALLLLLWFWPGLKRGVEEAPKGSRAEWLGLVKPLGLVVTFVILLIIFARA